MQTTPTPAERVLRQTERLLRMRELCRTLGTSRPTVYREIRLKRFPRPIKLGRASAWLESEVMAWIEARRAERDGA